MSKRKLGPVDFLRELQDERSDAFLQMFSGVDRNEQQANQDSGSRSSDQHQPDERPAHDRRKR
jgi:hypothetical protein